YTDPRGIYPGDIYTAVTTTLPLTNPPVTTTLQTQKPRIFFYTQHKAYTDIINASVSPPTGNQLGDFTFLIPDPNRVEENNFSVFERVTVIGKMGLTCNRVMKGIVMRTMPVRLKSGYWALEVTGNDIGGFLAIRRYDTQVTYTNTEISVIVKDIVQG